MAADLLVIVDDHPMFRRALAQSLRPTFPDADIVEAGSVGALLDWLAAGSYVDLILLDLEMPDVQGLSGLAAVRTQYPAIPVAIMSANDEVATMRRCLDHGASGYIPKSTPMEHVRSAVRSILSGSLWLPPNFDVLATGRNLASRLTTLTPQQRRAHGFAREPFGIGWLQTFAGLFASSSNAEACHDFLIGSRFTWEPRGCPAELGDREP
jgi:DNA-binding NarL/FixJ family response regulator